MYIFYFEPLYQTDATLTKIWDSLLTQVFMSRPWKSLDFESRSQLLWELRLVDRLLVKETSTGNSRHLAPSLVQINTSQTIPLWFNTSINRLLIVFISNNIITSNAPLDNLFTQNINLKWWGWGLPSLKKKKKHIRLTLLNTSLLMIWINS